MKVALRSRLLANSTITAAVGTRVDWEARPQAKGLPAITLSLPSDVRDSHMGGTQATLLPFVQIDVWASKAIDAHTLSDEVVAELQPAATVSGVRFLGAPTLTVSTSTEDTDFGLVHRAMIRGTIAHTIP